MLSFKKLGNYGGFGNQLFQYAFLRSLAQKLQVPFYCPEWSGDEIFDLNDSTERSLEFKDIRNEYLEPKTDCGFRRIALDIQDGTNLSGYFQSEKYFFNKEAVKEWFRPKKDLNSLKDQFTNIDFSQSVSLSHRLGDDYQDLRCWYPAYTIQYYLKALNHIKDKKHILIFSDRPDRAKDFWKKHKSNNFIFIEKPSAIDQFHLMSLCRNNVITNSTFSWWSAWLNSHTDKTVVAPKEWFRPKAPIQATDVIPDSWTTIHDVGPLEHYPLWLNKFRIQRKWDHLLSQCKLKQPNPNFQNTYDGQI